ncbi:TIGR04282 family arsenosugar biosynthesis glycosyltransferase [Pseudothauera rhizosphaerae]|uniref:Glycosyltransferase n=1 Tax=Pseudothauera rhizosphaerae TaxID=2565932 RepID=A0A4S4AS28_9RHOO|nr:TIGR04282 family arsenosugar biosynthesis glycosyltransferase [Pseudothauera rhizosphaerae]THF62651.1 glycosyltransferase [Pseudothauera rhizosphaerae]
MNSRVDVAVLARAPTPGMAKTRLIPALGAEAAARLHRRLVIRSLGTACAARLGGSVTLWGTPSLSHRFFRALGKRGVSCREQPSGDLGVRMQYALACSLPRPVLLIGTDCPGMTAGHLRAAARSLIEGKDAVILPAEDGGYVLIGLRSAAHASLFDGVPWGTSQVMEATRQRLRQLRYAWAEPAMLWDVDTPADLARLSGTGLI